MKNVQTTRASEKWRIIARIPEMTKHELRSNPPFEVNFAKNKKELYNTLLPKTPQSTLNEKVLFNPITHGGGSI